MTKIELFKDEFFNTLILVTMQWAVPPYLTIFRHYLFRFQGRKRINVPNSASNDFIYEQSNI